MCEVSWLWDTWVMAAKVRRMSIWWTICGLLMMAESIVDAMDGQVSGGFRMYKEERLALEEECIKTNPTMF